MQAVCFHLCFALDVHQFSLDLKNTNGSMQDNVSNKEEQLHIVALIIQIQEALFPLNNRTLYRDVSSWNKLGQDLPRK